MEGSNERDMVYMAGTRNRAAVRPVILSRKCLNVTVRGRFGWMNDAMELTNVYFFRIS